MVHTRGIQRGEDTMGATGAVDVRPKSNGAVQQHGTFDLVLTSGDRYVQAATFPGETFAPLILDEPPPLSGGVGPNPARVLGAAVGGCLAASLLFCLRKAHIDVAGMTTAVRGSLARNERGRLRVNRIEVTLRPVVAAQDHMRVVRCATVFEDYCVVTASVRRAIDVAVRVEPVHPPER
jgi:organic hydroperoxide reductase OsmC/OhrA